MSGTTAPTLFLADDHPLFLEGLHMILAKKRFEVLGSATNGTDALAGILALQPDIAILDISMPGLSGIGVARELRRRTKTKIILLTAAINREQYEEAVKLEICGYVLKDNTRHELLNAVGYVQNGDTYISPLLSGRLLKKAFDDAGAANSLAGLTSTEKKVLSLLAENKTTQEIAGIMLCSPKTVKNHRHSICEKLNLMGHNALLHFAIQHKDRFN